MRLSTRSLVLGAGLLAWAGCHTANEDGPSVVGQNPLSITAPAPVPVVSNPAPTPTPQPTPHSTPTPTPGSTGGPVAKAAIGVVYVVCDNQGVPDSQGATRVPVGCRIQMDLNLKDANNVPTDFQNPPEWRYSNHWSFDVVDDNPWGPLLHVTDQGDVSIFVIVDGINSNEYRLHFYYP